MTRFACSFRSPISTCECCLHCRQGGTHRRPYQGHSSAASAWGLCYSLDAEADA